MLCHQIPNLNNMFKLSTTKLLFVTIVLLVVVVSLFVLFVLKLNKASSGLELAVQTIANEAEFRKDQQTLKTILDNTSDIRTELLSYVLSGDGGTVQFLSLVDKTAADLGIKLSTTKLEVRPAAKGRFNTLLVSFSLEGSEPSVEKMLKALEVLPYSSRIMDLELNRSFNTITGINQVTGSVGMEISIIES